MLKFFALLVLSLNLCIFSLPTRAKAEDSQNRIIRIEDNRVVPNKLRMKLEDSILFFMNATTEALVTLEIDYQDKTTHCASDNLKIHEHGVIASTRPIPPRDFGTVCFHEKGAYPLIVYGLPAHRSGLRTRVIVE